MIFFESCLEIILWQNDGKAHFYYFLRQKEKSSVVIAHSSYSKKIFFHRQNQKDKQEFHKRNKQIVFIV